MVDVLIAFYEYYLEQDFAYQFIGGIVFFLFVFSIVLLIWILISRTVKNRKGQKEKHWNGVFQEVLVKLLFERNYSRDSENYRKLVGTYHADKMTLLVRRSLITNMVELHKGVTGESAEILEQFFRDAGLVKSTVNEIKKGAWYYKARGFRELSEFRISEQYDAIVDYVDDSNKVLRQEAQYAAVVLRGPEALEFVPQLKSPISEWQQLVLLEKLVQFMPEDIPSVDHWLTSKNDSVIVFGARIIAQFQKYESSELVLQLVRHPNEWVAIKGLECIRELHYKNGCPALRKAYVEVSEKVQVLILDTLAELGDTGDLNFFKKEVEEKETFDVVMHAAIALRKLGGTAMLKILDQKELKYINNKAIVRHALDERI